MGVLLEGDFTESLPDGHRQYDLYDRDVLDIRFESDC